MKKIFIITGADEWLTDLIIEKLSKKYSVALVKVKSNKSSFLKMLKLIILIGFIDILKITLIQIKKKKYKIIKLKKNQLNTFLTKINNDKIFLVNLPIKINGSFKNIYNCHTSLLPNYKGLLIIQRAIYDILFNKKKSKIGITIHKLNKKFDAGTIVWNKEIRLNFYEKCKFKDIYENFYLNFYYGIDNIASYKKKRMLLVKKKINLKKTINFFEIIKLKIKLL